MTLNDSDIAMIREMGRGYNGPEFDHYLEAVRRRLTVLEESGVQITRNHVRAAATAELAP